MDDRSFDAVARALSAGTPRRQALRLLAASALAGLLPRRGQAAPARQDGCAPGLTYCEEQPSWAPAGCYDLASDYLHCGACMHQCPSASPAPMACVGGECVPTACPEGWVDCTGNVDCADVSSDANNCGACGVVCQSGICDAGQCAQLACGDMAYCEVGESWYCADVSSDPLNCGACGVVCDSGVCEGWACAAGCGEGLAYCPVRSDGQPAGCYDLFSDYFHCGSCDHSCPTAGAPGVVCNAGECALPPCDGNLIRCDGVGCVDLLVDPNNCGTCGNSCLSGVCDGGACAANDASCAAGLTYCEEQPSWAPAGCYDLATDYLHCGDCMHQCPSAGPVEMACSGGACVTIGCGDLTDCTGNLDCADLASDPNNCGACGNVCESGTCEGGACVDACAAGLTSCPLRSDGQPAGCYDLSADFWHCGTCDMSCPTAGFHGVCSGGQCVEIGCAASLTYCTAQGNGLQPGCYDLASDRDHCGACDVQCPTTVGCFAGECGLPPCDGDLTRCASGCVDLDADPDNCGACDNACDSGVCEAGACAVTATQAILGGAATTPGAGEEPAGQEAPNDASGRGERPGRTRPRQRADVSSGPAGAAAPERSGRRAEATAAPSVLAWPFDPEAGQWTIVHGYRVEDGDAHATPTADGGDGARVALEFAVCPAASVDAAEGVCDLGEGGDTPDWDRKATQGSAVRSPVDGTVAWVDDSSPTCRRVGLTIAGHPDYRLALFPIEGELERGQSVKQGKRIGKIAPMGERGCAEGNRLHMALYTPQPGADDDPVAGRKGIPFAGDWAIAGCDYPDDRRTIEQYRGELVPCSAEDEAAAGP
jgi:hypothetical protein